MWYLRVAVPLILEILLIVHVLRTGRNAGGVRVDAALRAAGPEGVDGGCAEGPRLRFPWCGHVTREGTNLWRR